MHKKFDSEAIEKKWQKIWSDNKIYDVGVRDHSKKKQYVLVEWPYPSGNLHIGHWYAFAVPDIYVRFKRMMGDQVLFPIGFDAFGLPAENAAIKRNINPKNWTDDNIAFMKTQLDRMGNAFSWDKTTSSTDPEYYAWTQWMFTQFFENDIAYRGVGAVNWCPGCNTVIANEQVLANNTCERSGDAIERRVMPQWMLRITNYADRLIDDLETLNWPEPIKEAQRQWIGRSAGAEINFLLNFKKNPSDNKNRGPHGERAQIPVFTTRPDTLFGATYLVLAPEHPWVTLAIDDLHDVLHNKDKVTAYVKEAKQQNDIERTNAKKEKTGVELQGVVAINPANGEEIPMYVADYVLGGYGTGAIMGVPAHDERDFAFAKKYKLPIKTVVEDIHTKEATHVGAILQTTQGEFLFQKRTQDAPRFPSKVAFFGGGIEENETPVQALQRELMEELELDITINGGEPKLINVTKMGVHNELVSANYFINTIDDSTLVLHEGESIYRCKKIDDIVVDERADNMLNLKDSDLTTPFTLEGVLINSDEFTGMDSEDAKISIVNKVGGKLTNTYRLRDWSIGRQRYWGVPIPIVYDPEGKAHAIPKEHLPWLLPTDVDFKPTGEAPLAKSAELKARTEQIFGEGWTPEVETMDTFVDSSWYFLRYINNQNSVEFSSREAQKDWMQVDLYFGGAEHTTMHLLYSRFWQKALLDLGYVEGGEPYKRRINRGLILGPDGNKMSKSKGNVIDPDEQVKRVGADTIKMYLAFMGPYGETTNYPWDMGGIAGVRRFLERVYGLQEHITESETIETKRLVHKTIAKVTSDITLFKFNTAISACMILINHVETHGIGRENYEIFIRLLAPFAPHLAEELWQKLGNTDSIHTLNWPEANLEFCTNESQVISVQINGKMRGTVEVSFDATEEIVLEMIKNTASLSHKITTPIKKVIFVQNKIINLILESTLNT